MIEGKDDDDDAEDGDEGECGEDIISVDVGVDEGFFVDFLLFEFGSSGFISSSESEDGDFLLTSSSTSLGLANQPERTLEKNSLDDVFAISKTQ